MRDVVDGKSIVLGTMAPGSTTYDTAAVVNAALDLNMKLVPGYDGVSRIILAVEGKEVDGYCASFLSMVTTAPQLLQGDNPVVGSSSSWATRPDHPWLARRPAVDTGENRRVAAAAGGDPRAVADQQPLRRRHRMAADRVAALRQAFWETFQDPQFQAEAQHVGITFTPSTGEQVTRVVGQPASARRARPRG